MEGFVNTCLQLLTGTRPAEHGSKGKPLVNTLASAGADAPDYRNYEKASAEDGNLWWGDSAAQSDTGESSSSECESGEAGGPFRDTEPSCIGTGPSSSAAAIFCDEGPPPRPPRRRKSSVRRVAYRWGLSLVDAAEIVEAFEASQTLPLPAAASAC